MIKITEINEKVIYVTLKLRFAAINMDYLGVKSIDFWLYPYVIFNNPS